MAGIVLSVRSGIMMTCKMRNVAISKSPVLHLDLHRKFFAQIAAGTKRTEYRSRTPYWRSGLWR